MARQFVSSVGAFTKKSVTIVDSSNLVGLSLAAAGGLTEEMYRRRGCCELEAERQEILRGRLGRLGELLPKAN